MYFAEKYTSLKPLLAQKVKDDMLTCPLWLVQPRTVRKKDEDFQLHRISAAGAKSHGV